MSDFKALVRSEKDVVGALAYSLVLLKRSAARANFLKEFGRRPDDDERETLHLAIRSDLDGI